MATSASNTGLPAPSFASSAQSENSCVPLNAWAPFVRFTGDLSGKLSHYDVVRLHWIRWLYIFIFAVAYFQAIRSSNSSKMLMSGELKEALEEFFPEAGKTGERLTESEVTPGFKELIHGDDVAKTLTWFQMFCMQKAGSDDHVPWAWNCEIGTVELGPTHPVPWNVINDTEPTQSQEWEDAKLFRNHICSSGFLKRHIKLGDDPRKVYFGKTESFQKLIKEENSSLPDTRLNPAYDEFTVLSGNPMRTDIVAEGVQNGLDETFDNHLVEPSEGSSLVQAVMGHNRVLSQSQTFTADKYDGVDESDNIPQWCYQEYTSVLLILLRKVQEVDVDDDGELTKREGEMLARGLGIDDVDNFWNQLDTDSDGIATLVDIDELAHHHTQEMLQNLPQRLAQTCRNHHWGMLPVCGPEWIKVQFHIENAHWDTHGKSGIYTRTAFADITLSFAAVGYDGSNEHSAPTGWFRSQIHVESESFHGSGTYWNFVAGCVALILFCILFLAEYVYTVFRWPLTIFELVMLSKRTSRTTVSEITRALTRLVDGRYARARFMSPSWHVMEFVLTTVFIFAVIRATTTGFENTIPNVGKFPSASCQRIYEERLYDFMSNRAFEFTRDDSGLISPVTYITHCLNPKFHNIIPDLVTEMVWDAPRSHGFAFLFTILRLLDIFNAFSGTAWLPRTMTLAAPKLCYFFIFYIWTIAGWAVLFNVSFGAYFIQFRTYGRSFYVLMLFSFGFRKAVFDGIHTFEESQSHRVTILLLFFSIFTVLVGIQFFTSIVLDAYATVHDMEDYIKTRSRSDKKLFLYEKIARRVVPTASLEERNFRQEFAERSHGYTIHQLFSPTRRKPLAKETFIRRATMQSEAERIATMIDSGQIMPSGEP